MDGYSGTLTNRLKESQSWRQSTAPCRHHLVCRCHWHTASVVAIPLDNTMTTLAAGWYVVNSDVDYPVTVTLSGDVT